MRDQLHNIWYGISRLPMSGAAAVVHGDVQAVLADVPDGTYHGCLCDPPYGLKLLCNNWDRLPAVEDWQAIYRVLRPGSYLLAFGSPRTFHRLTVAIEDAGFDVKDVMAWLYTSGVPKGKQIAKAVDKVSGTDPVLEKEIAAWIAESRKAKGITLSAVDRDVFGASGRMRFVEGRVDHVSRYQIYLPPWEEWVLLKEYLELDDRYDGYIRSAIPSRAMRQKFDGGKATQAVKPGRYYYQKGQGAPVESRATTPRSLEAVMWDGYDVALKPAWEPIVVAAKPVELTLGRNAVDHGVAGLNIEPNRVGERWPANVVVALDSAPEIQRYVFTTKAGKKERSNNPHPSVKPIDLCQHLASLILPPGPASLLVPFAGSGSEAIGALHAGWDLIVAIEADAAYAQVARDRISKSGYRMLDDEK